jgi:divalent metal cation (Fe/Co/Zn/Cd) transporter
VVVIINLLIKVFVKDYKNTRNSDVRESYGLLASSVGILFSIKLFVGLYSNSISIIAD